MIEVSSAINIVLSQSRLTDIVDVPIMDSLGLVLAQDVISPRNIPPFDNSAMDGYALLSEDTANVSEEQPASLQVIASVPAGAATDLAVVSGLAIKIMTGAPLPQGANAVVRVEDTKASGNHVLVYSSVVRRENIRLAGEDVRYGDLALKAGEQITPACVGMLASLGMQTVKVYRRPVVAVIATGDEIAELGEESTENKIINSNAYTIRSLLLTMGAIPVYLGIVKDTKEALKNAFMQAIERADIIISSGGVSAGDYDFVEDVWRAMGAEINFAAVAQRPGKPMIFGNINGKLIFGLPGNPVSTMVAFIVYIHPCILQMMGRKAVIRKKLVATIEEDIAKKAGLTYFVRGILQERQEGLFVKTTGEQGSGILMSMVLGNCLVILPPTEKALKAGSKVEIIPLDDSFFFMPSGVAV